MYGRQLAVAVLGSLALTAFFGPSSAARSFINLGPKDDFAFDQPAITIEVFEQTGSGNNVVKGSSLGPSGGGFFTTNSFILDTGATSIIAFSEPEHELRDNGYVTENTVLEQGVSGFEELDVSKPYYLEFTDSSPSVFALPSTRIMSSATVGDSLFGVNGIVGMPAMAGRVVTLDTSVWADIEDILDLVPMNTLISSSLAASAGHRYSAPITARTFDVIGDPPLPTSAPISMLTMSVGADNKDATGSFILDTGAAISFISTEMALALGLDSNHDGVLNESDERSGGTLPIGGIGGEIEAPIFAIDRMTVPTEQGVDLVWNNEQLTSVAIVDLGQGIDGVLGADLMTSGWFSFALEEEGSGAESGPGPIQQLHFDFRQFTGDGSVGKIYFDLTDSFDVIQAGPSAGDFNLDGTVDAADYTVWRDTLGSTRLLNADGNGNNIVDAADYSVWHNHFGDQSGSIPGDYNHNGAVDAADYSLWRDTLGSTTNLAADGNGNNVVDAADYTFWKSRFGNTSGTGGAGSTTAAVPEPSGLVLITLVVIPMMSLLTTTTRRARRKT